VFAFLSDSSARELWQSSPRVSARQSVVPARLAIRLPWGRNGIGSLKGRCYTRAVVAYVRSVSFSASQNERPEASQKKRTAAEDGGGVNGSNVVLHSGPT